MKRHAVINKNNEIVNVVIWDGVSKWTPPQDHRAVHFNECDIGDRYDPLKNKIIKADRTAREIPL